MNSVFIAALHFTVTVGSSIMEITPTLMCVMFCVFSFYLHDIACFNCLPSIFTCNTERCL